MSRKSDSANEGDSPRDRLAARLAELKPGERLPAEPQLAEELAVSRPTLREALRSAEDAGLVIRRPGVGTVKTHVPPLSNDLSLNTGVTDLILEHGLRPGTRVIGIERRPSTEQEARRLGIATGSPVWVADRVRTADGTPVIDSRDVVSEDVAGPDGLTAKGLTQNSMYGYLSDKGHEVQHGVASIHPVRASGTLAERLGVRRGAMLLRLVQIDYDIGGDPVLLSIEHHLPGAFEFSVSRRGPATGTA